MPVWWGIFAYSIFMAALGSIIFKNKQGSSTDIISLSSETQSKSIGLFFAFLTFALLIYFAGHRSWMFDTTAYQDMYNITYSSDLNQISYIINGKIQTRGPGFAILLVLFKHFTNGTYHDWFFFLAIIQGVSIAVFFYRYSTNYTFSVYLFIAAGCCNWMVNGIRQFLAVSIILFFSEWLIKRKTIPFLIVILVAYYIHSTTLLWIPFYFIIDSKPWSKKFIILSLLVTVGVILFYNSSYFSDSEYSYLTSEDLGTGGVNPIRVLALSMPTIIAFVNRKSIAEKASPFINICINISVLSTECYIIGMFTSGVVGRLPIYFELFNYILLPWVLKNTLNEDMGKGVTTACIIGFFAYYYYDMLIKGSGIYASETLQLFYID